MKILVIGGSGLVGSHILRAARAAGHEAIGTYRQFSEPGLIPCDCASDAAIADIVRTQAPDAVVHAAGWTWVDGCEDDPARALAENAQQPKSLAKICHSLGVHFAYVSTSYVFDGSAGPYAEDAAPRPINVYAQSKWEGEQRVQQACGGAALLPRVICVYGVEARRKNFAYQVLNALHEGKTLTLPSDQCGNPTFAGDIARWLVVLLERRERGVWHLGGPWPDCTRLEWAEKLVTAFARAGIHASPGFGLKMLPTRELKQRALRPLRAGMISIKTGALGFQPADFDTSVRELVASSV